ncbi:DUF4386 domain-containing protein [Labilibacter sediminis]|nr:DUF4386 domain-containing protein [Labilibacter sediminis]
MKKAFNTITQKQAAIISGFAIIAMTIAAVIATDVTIQNLVVKSDASETLNNILAAKTKFNIGVLSWLIILICDLFAAWGLYLFFKPVKSNLSLITAWFRLAYVAMLAVSILNLIYVHLIIHQAEPLISGASGRMAENTMFYLNAFDAMWAVSLIVFGVHILFVGCLSLKSEHIPNVFGIILMIAFIGYIFPKTSNLLFPQYKDFMRTVEAIFLLPMLGEVALGIWLLVIGLRREVQVK